jgi:hypothetical protein
MGLLVLELVAGIIGMFMAVGHIHLVQSLTQYFIKRNSFPTQAGSMNRKVTIIIAFVVLIFLIVYNLRKNSRDSSRYFDELALHLKGEVLSVDVPNGYNGFGILKVKVLESNINNYDLRNKSDTYYCIIKNGLAEIYQLGVVECKPGDIVIVDTQKKEFTIQKRDGGKIVKDIVLYTNEFFYKYVKKHHQDL